MSLINEALKRTRDASYQANPAREAMADNYRVSGPVEIRSSGKRVALWIGGCVGAVVLFGLGVFAFLSLRHSAAVEIKATGTPVIAKTEASAAPAPAPVAKQTPPEPPAAPIAEPAKPVPAPAPVAAAPAVPPAPEPEPPKLVLEGITGGAHDREAMINGVSLRVGDEFEGVTVVAIESRLVRVKFGTREIQLRMQ